MVNGPFTGTKERRSFKPKVASSILVGRMRGVPADAGLFLLWSQISSADLFRQLDDDPLGAADVAEPVAVLVAHQLADEFGAAGL